MNSGGYTIEVMGLSPKATEQDVYDFFAFSGAIENVESARKALYSGLDFTRLEVCWAV